MFESCELWVDVKPMLSEWRWERPHMVCSSTVIGLRFEKEAGSSTYYRENENRQFIVKESQLKDKALMA